jgi:hypothetical protein
MGRKKAATTKEEAVVAYESQVAVDERGRRRVVQNLGIQE